MKKTAFILFMLVSINIFSQKINFDKYFENKSLRIDYIHAGNADTAYVFLQEMRKEPYWGGSHTNLLDTFNYGEYRIKVFDKKSQKLIYSHGYSTIFQEWQITPEAKTVCKSFYEGVLIPYPKDSVIVTIEQIDKHNIYHETFRYTVNPKNMFIKKELPYNFETKDLLNNGNPANKVDIVILAEGYTKNQMDKFEKDAQRLTNALFSYEPFKKHKKDFNIHLVKSYSADSGTDIPGENIWKNTILNTNFWTFGTERYLTTLDYKTVLDLAALAPYDQIYIIVNTDKYGGGGIYNFYNLCVADNLMAPQVFVHEFGHGFGGLADEYAYGDTSNEDTYDLSVEPQAPNITTLVNFSSKWKDMVRKNTPIPTPKTKKYEKSVGAFEGAGYVNKGVYRPQQNCIMRSLDYPFCKVCNRELSRMINFFSE